MLADKRTQLGKPIVYLDVKGIPLRIRNGAASHLGLHSLGVHPLYFILFGCASAIQHGIQA